MWCLHSETLEPSTACFILSAPFIQSEILWMPLRDLIHLHTQFSRTFSKTLESALDKVLYVWLHGMLEFQSLKMECSLLKRKKQRRVSPCYCPWRLLKLGEIQLPGPTEWIFDNWLQNRKADQQLEFECAAVLKEQERAGLLYIHIYPSICRYIHILIVLFSPPLLCHLCQDLKPSNVAVNEDCELRVRLIFSDWGLKPAYRSFTPTCELHQLKKKKKKTAFLSRRYSTLDWPDRRTTRWQGTWRHAGTERRRSCWTGCTIIRTVRH